MNEAGELGFDESDIVECVGALSSAHFYKTMEAEKRRGFWQDVYRTEYGGIPLYVKLQLEGQTPGDTVEDVAPPRAAAKRDRDEHHDQARPRRGNPRMQLGRQAGGVRPGNRHPAVLRG